MTRKRIPDLPEPTVRRLSFIKFQLAVAVEQSRLPEPTQAISLLSFHDAIELFLQLASEHLNCAKENYGFMAYWEVLSKKLSEPLPYQEAIRRLNSARVALKHHGTFPSALDLEAFRGTAVALLTDATKLVFNVSLDEISLVDLVADTQVNSILKEAIETLETNAQKAMEHVAIAFAHLLANYEATKRRAGRSPFFFGKSIRSRGVFLEMSRDLAEFAGEVTESIDAMQQAMRVMSFGIDFRRYTKFRLLTPSVFRPVRGAFQVQWLPFGADPKPNKDDVDYCVEFVINSALRLQQFDYRAELAAAAKFFI